MQIRGRDTCAQHVGGLRSLALGDRLIRMETREPANDLFVHRGASREKCRTGASGKRGGIIIADRRDFVARIRT